MNIPDKGVFGENGGIPFDAFIIMGGDEGSPHTSPTIDIMIAVSLREGAGMCDELTEAYLSSNNAIHATGLPHADSQEFLKLNAARASYAVKMTDLFKFMTAPRERFEAHAVASGADFWKTRKVIEEGMDLDTDLASRWLTRLHEYLEEGIARSEVIGELLDINRFNYAPELDRSDAYEPHPDDREQVASAVGTAELDTGVTISDVVLRLREQGIADGSVERLDMRHQNLRSVIQVEATMTFLQNIQDMWTVGGPAREAALALFTRHRASMLQDNYQGKQAMLGQAIATVNRLLDRDDIEGQYRDFLQAFSARMQIFTDGCRDIEEEFAAIRERLTRPTEQVVAGAAGAVVTGEAVTESEPEPDPEVVAGLPIRAANLTGRADSVNQHWRMKKQAIVKAGLSGAVGRLTGPDGLYSVSGEFLLPHMDRHNAEELVAVLRQLSLMGGREPIEAQQRQLESILLLDAQITGLRTEISDLAPNQGIELPSLIAPTHIDKMLANWRHYEQVILTIWPPAEARKVITNIQTLLRPVTGNTRR